MKKIVLMLLAIAGIMATAEARTIYQSDNHQEEAILESGESVGGVDATVVSKLAGKSNGVETYKFSVKFKNYNSFPVTVYYQVGPEDTVGTAVLLPNKSTTKHFATVGGIHPTNRNFDPKLFNVHVVARKL